MSKGSPSVPATPDPNVISGAQTKSNVSTAASQAALNNVNQVTPYGSTTYNQTGSYTDAYGNVVPEFTQNTQLSPLTQEILNQQGGIATTQLGNAGNVANQFQYAPYNFNTADSGTLNQAPQVLNQNVTNALYGQQKSFLDPQWDQQQQQLQDQLSRQGIAVGSDAYNNAQKQFDNSKTQAYQSAQDSAIGQGVGAESSLFNLALAGQNQNISQQTLQQTQPISLVQQLLGATPQIGQQQPTPIPQAGVSPTDVTGANSLSTQAAMQRYQAQLAANNAQFGGLAGLGGAALQAPSSTWSGLGSLFGGLGGLFGSAGGAAGLDAAAGSLGAASGGDAIASLLPFLALA